MNRQILHTPDGVRDIYEKECREKRYLEDNIHKVLGSYGYRDIETPTFEFFDVFSSEVGTLPSRQLYKFFDKDGNTLALRPDFTPSIARACSKYFMDRCTPVRLCYQGNTFINNSNYQGRLKETTQLGAELISDGSVDADAEILSMAIDVIRATGLEEFQISLGNVQYFKALLRQAELSDTEEEELAELIRNKNRFGVRRMLASRDLPDNLKEALAALPALTGGEEVLDMAESYAAGSEASKAIQRLREVKSILAVSGLDRYVSFDLGMMSSYMYYTGIIFRGYTYGTGEAIIKGGRYDALLGHFGKDAPSIGFVVVLDQLMNALARQKVMPELQQNILRILYDPSEREEAIRTARELRGKGTNVELLRVDTAEQAVDYSREAAAQQIKTLRIGGAS